MDGNSNFLNKFVGNPPAMRLLRYKHFFTGIFLLAFANATNAQAGLCPPNLDFEQGDFTNWTCKAGSANIGPGGVNTITWASAGPPVADRHTIIPLAGAGDDFYGGFPRIAPNSSGYSVLLGNQTATITGGIGREASGVSYQFTVPPTATTFSIFFYYAVVLENPNHPTEQQPRFRATLRDLTTGADLPCVTFDFIASSSLGGFLPSPRNPAVLYKDWTPVTLDLSGLAGRTIELEFIVSECTQAGHFAYAYVDVNTSCNSPIQGATLCQGDDALTLTAPFGYQSYEWFSDIGFGTPLATTQNLLLDPAPSVGTVYPVIITPYPGFGCRDTLYATIEVAPKPVSDAGPDVTVCKSGTVQLGTTSNPIHAYEWTPSAQVSSPIVSDPQAWITGSTPTEFIVKTTDILTGCFSYDTTIVSRGAVDTAMGLTGPASFCDDGTPKATLTLNPAVTPIQWYDDAGPIPGANASTFSPLATGNYWAQVTGNGCTDSTRTVNIRLHPFPDALFIPLEDTLCVTGGALLFTNQSTVPDASPMTYNWKFSDGTTLQTVDANKSFTGVGDYTVELVATTQAGCKDSLLTNIYVMPNGVPDFAWDSICVDRPVLFRNQSNEAGSASVNYSWTFNDGGSGSLIKDPPPVTYTTDGIYDVTLEMVTLGCEDAPQTITKPVKVNKAAPGTQYRTITVPQGSSAYLHARPGIGEIYNWQPKVQLSSYTTQYTEFFATNDNVRYLIDIVNKNTCVTTDTVLMQILKKPGHYLATAFTPNGDGLNDVLQPYLVGMKGLKSFSVFNRWGNLIFRTNTYGEAWDGKFKGEDQPPAVYVWILEYHDANNKLVTVKGTVTIIR